MDRKLISSTEMLQLAEFIEPRPTFVDEMEYVLLLAKPKDFLDDLKKLTTCRLRKCKSSGAPLGIDDGFALARLKGLSDNYRREFLEEVSSNQGIEAIAPALRTFDGQSIYVTPGEINIGFSKTGVDHLPKILERYGCKKVAELGRRRFRLRLKQPAQLSKTFADLKANDELFELVSLCQLGTLSASDDEGRVLGMMRNGIPTNLKKRHFEGAKLVRDKQETRKPIIAAINIRSEYSVLITDSEVESVSAREEFVNSLNDLEEADSISILGKSHEQLLDSSIVVIRLEDESESEEIVGGLSNLDLVDGIFPGIEELTSGRIAFADFREVVVSLKDSDGYEEFATEYGLEVQTKDNRGKFAVLHASIGNEELVTGILERISDDYRVAFAEPAYLSEDEDGETAPDTENDAPNDLWHHQNIKRDEAISKLLEEDLPNSNVVVAVVDKVLDLDHPLLEGSIVSTDESLNFSGSPRQYTHGTHVTGIIAGGKLGDLEIGVHSQLKVLPIGIWLRLHRYDHRAKALNFLSEILENGSWLIPGTEESIVIDRLVVNCSWQTRVHSELIKDSIDGLLELGAIVCCSAGNDNKDAQGKHYPSDYEGVVCVAALDSQGRKYEESEFRGSNYGERIDICAPGGNGLPKNEGDIFSAIKNGMAGYSYGTSMATPLVSSLAALAWTANPDLSAGEVVDVIMNTAKDISSSNDEKYHGLLGAGQLNMESAISSILDS